MGIRSKHVFFRVVSGEGIISFLRDVVCDLERIYLLRGAGPSGRSLFMRLVGMGLRDRGEEVEFFHSPFDYISIEGIVVREKRLGIFDGEVFTLEGGETAIQVKNLEEVFLPGGSDEEEAVNEEAFQEVTALLQEAANTWKSFCYCRQAAVDYGLVQKKVASWSRDVLSRPSKVRSYFAVSLTAEGEVGFISSLTRGCMRRYLVCGLPGSGFLLLSQVYREVLSRHYNVEAYYSYLNLEEPLLLFLPEEEIAFVDTTFRFGVEVLPRDIIWEVPLSSQVIESEELRHEPESLGILLKKAAQVIPRLRGVSKTARFSLENELLARMVNDFISRLIRDIA